MVEYPYGRSGRPLCFDKELSSIGFLNESARIGDNRMVRVEDKVFLYEAPGEDDPGRGHFSVWERVGEGRFEQVKGISGDDGMCFDMFEDAVGD